MFFKHLRSTATCCDSHNSLCFKIIDKANSKFDLEIKEALHINWRKPNLNAQQNHLALILSLQLLFPLLLYVFVCFSFVSFCISVSCIVFVISTVIIGIFYCPKANHLAYIEPTTAHKIFENNSSFHVKQCTAEKV